MAGTDQILVRTGKARDEIEDLGHSVAALIRQVRRIARLSARSMLLWSAVFALTTTFVALASPASAEPVSTWLCRPGQAGDPCGGGSGAPIDCFYVYPTASLQQSTNANFDASPELRAVASTQAGPFGVNCNVWAPVYRQVTVRALFNGTAQERSAGSDLAYQDVERAWDDYLTHHNNGRGVVLLGHSQGSAMLRILIRNRIEGKPVQSQLVSALLIGNNILVPKGATVGGDFSSVPACTDQAQTGCVIAYESFSETPPPDTRFGLSPQVPGGSAIRGDLPFGPEYEVLCTNPASLRDNDDAPIHGIVEGREVDRFRARCTGGDGPHVLMVEGPGAELLPTLPNKTWGLHLLDINLAQRDLVNLVGTQSAAYRR
ncbi:DUF3089 domain-containing protein [Nocardia sp. NPDC050710]|uniref:DUF3089 domain-containing protein n=1 Tax=Nocardia sp. NPDC050710 TaxID=3157220 RepID=UPI0034070A69